MEQAEEQPQDQQETGETSDDSPKDQQQTTEEAQETNEEAQETGEQDQEAGEQAQEAGEQDQGTEVDEETLQHTATELAQKATEAAEHEVISGTPQSGSGKASPAGQTAQSPVGQTAQSPAGQTAQSPAGQTAQSPAGQAAQSPAGQAAQSPVGQAAQSPAQDDGLQAPGIQQQYDHRNTPSPEDGMMGQNYASPRGPPPPGDQQVEGTLGVSTQDALPPSDMSYIPSPPPPPGSDTKDQAKDDSINALNLAWSFGMSRNVPVINMSNDDRKMVAYACGHTGVLYNVHNNSQILLQGHANSIASMCVSGDHRWLATADIGPDNMIIVWDSLNGNPVRTIFDPHPDGAVAMAMTPDARYLVSISLGNEEEQQTLAIWDWTVESETPLATAELNPKYGTQNYVLFNPLDTTQLVSNSETQVIFYSWKSGEISYFAPPLSDDDFNKPVGRYSQSIFLGNTTRALTATSNGNLVVWDTNKPLTKVVSTETTPDKKALKLVKLQERGLSVLTTTEHFIVAGDVLGHVKFFDQTLKLMNWYQDFHLGPINSLSFSHIPDFAYDVPVKNEYPADATIKAKKFFIRDFVVGTTNAVFGYCATDGTDVQVIHRDHDAAVHAIDAHPNQPKFVVGSYSGLLKIWDYEQKEVIVSRTFDRGAMIRSCSYDPKGHYIAVGFTNGTLRVVDAITLDDTLRRPFHYCRDAITHIAFSHDSRFLATADAEYTTTVYQSNQGDGDPYLYLGRYRAHYKTINSVIFGKQLDGEAPRLLSLAEDRHLVEYELDCERGELRVASCDRIEQSATPYCMQWYPPITKESFIMTANDQFKLKLYNSTTKMCRKTLLGPTYGSPVQQMLVLPTADPINDKRYMAFITDDKIGLNILPLDGNPHNSMALSCHPLGVSEIVSSHDGKYLFTAGGMDATVHMWNINIQALEVQARLGGEGLVPFYGLLEGGRDGELFKELEDFFYYAQIRSQGVDTTEKRESSVTIPVGEIPFVARALGFYPSEQEIEDMKNEIKYSSYVETGKYTTEIDLGDFIQLFINHRPAFGLQPGRLQSVFDVLGLDAPEGAIIDRGELLDLLQNRGEHIKEYDLAEYLMTLLGYTEEGGNSELHQFDTAQAGTLIDQSLPQDISSRMFSDDLLGFGLYNSDLLQVENSRSSSTV